MGLITMEYIKVVCKQCRPIYNIRYASCIKHSVRLRAYDVDLKITDNIVGQSLWKTGIVLLEKSGLGIFEQLEA